MIFSEFGVMEKKALLLLDLNSFGPLKFTRILSTRSSNFLDITEQLLNGYNSNSIHNKPSNHQQYFSSCQYNYTKRSITCSLVVRGSPPYPTLRTLPSIITHLRRHFLSTENTPETC